MNSGLRVAHLDHTTEPGGAELALLRMLSSEPGWTPALLLPEVPEDEEARIRTIVAHSVQVVHLGPSQPAGAAQSANARAVVRTALRIARMAFALRRSPQFRGADVVHANTTRAAIYGRMALAFRRTPFVVHIRDFVDPDSLGRLGFELYRRYALRRATAVIANSRATLASAQPWLRDGAPTFVIPSAIGIPILTVAPRVSAQVTRVGMLARIDPWKGHELLLRAFAASEHLSGARLVVAGGPQFGHARFLAYLSELSRELGIEDRVDFVGHVVDVERLIDTLDVCVQSSTRREPLGQNVLQYLARGKPTIVANAGGPAELIEDGVNGLTFTPGNQGELTAALNTLASDEALRQRLADNASKHTGLLNDDEVSELHREAFSVAFKNDNHERVA